MTTVTIEQAQARLMELIADLKPGEEVLITQQDRPVARLIPEARKARKPRQPGTMVGKLTIIQEDDEHLKDFKDYMP